MNKIKMFYALIIWNVAKMSKRVHFNYFFAILFPPWLPFTLNGSFLLSQSLIDFLICSIVVHAFSLAFVSSSFESHFNFFFFLHFNSFHSHRNKLSFFITPSLCSFTSDHANSVLIMFRDLRFQFKMKSLILFHIQRNFFLLFKFFFYFFKNPIRQPRNSSPLSKSYETQRVERKKQICLFTRNTHSDANYVCFDRLVSHFSILSSARLTSITRFFGDRIPHCFHLRSDKPIVHSFFSFFAFLHSFSRLFNVRNLALAIAFST